MVGEGLGGPLCAGWRVPLRIGHFDLCVKITLMGRPSRLKPAEKGRSAKSFVFSLAYVALSGPIASKTGHPKRPLKSFVCRCIPVVALVALLSNTPKSMYYVFEPQGHRASGGSNGRLLVT